MIITGNNFGNSFIGGENKRPERSETPMGRDEGTGVVLEGATHVVVSGNSFSGLSTPAVVADEGCRKIVVSGNVITDVGKGTPDAPPAIDVDSAREFIVTNNVLDGSP